MDHLAQDLSLALEDSEPCGPGNFKINRRWGIKRRTRSAGNLHLCLTKSGDNHSDDSSSSNNDLRMNIVRGKHQSFHQSDSDDTSFSIAKTINSNSLHTKNISAFVTIPPKYCAGFMNKALNYSLESDSLNENSPARPNIRRKRKLKRMCVDETPIPPCGKRKRPQRLDPLCSNIALKSYRNGKKNSTVVSKIERLCCVEDDPTMMETQCEVDSESSISWSGGEGHEGDDELTDWAPQPETPRPLPSDCLNDGDSREIRAGCRRLHNERPSFTITTGANEKIARFLQDTARSELRLSGAEKDKLGQLATLYSLDLLFEGTNSLLRKTNRTPCMQMPQKHHLAFATGHKKIRTTNESTFA